MTICPFIIDSFSSLFSVLPDLQAYWQHTTFHLLLCSPAEGWIIQKALSWTLPRIGQVAYQAISAYWWKIPSNISIFQLGLKVTYCQALQLSFLDCPRATSESHLMFGWGSLFKGHIINSWHPNRELCLENFHSPCQDRKQSEVSWEKKYYTAVPIYPLKALTAWCL